MLLDTMRFDGTWVVITGAAGGIGAATCRAFSELGAGIVLAGRTAETLEEVAASLDGPSRVFPLDVTDAEAVDGLAAMTREEGLDVRVIVNNAGTNMLRGILDIEPEAWRGMIALGLDSIYLMSRAFLPQLMERRQTSIVNIASTFGLMGWPEVPSYSAARGGVIALTRQLAVDFGPKGVRINTICPGPTLSPRVAGYLEGGAIDADRLLGSVPLGRFATCEEVANVIAFVAGEGASFIHGATITVDGGQTSF